MVHEAVLIRFVLQVPVVCAQLWGAFAIGPHITLHHILPYLKHGACAYFMCFAKTASASCSMPNRVMCLVLRLAHLGMFSPHKYVSRLVADGILSPPVSSMRPKGEQHTTVGTGIDGFYHADSAPVPYSLYFHIIITAVDMVNSLFHHITSAPTPF